MTKRKARLDKNRDAKPLTEIVRPTDAEEVLNALVDHRMMGRRDVLWLIRTAADADTRLRLDEGLDIWIYRDELLALANWLEENLK